MRRDTLRSNDELYPLFVYLYNKEGWYKEPIRIENETALMFMFRGPIKEAIREKLEVRITDTGDLLCFHAANGSILWDGKTHYEPGEKTI